MDPFTSKQVLKIEVRGFFSQQTNIYLGLDLSRLRETMRGKSPTLGVLHCLSLGSADRSLLSRAAQP